MVQLEVKKVFNSDEFRSVYFTPVPQPQSSLQKQLWCRILFLALSRILHRKGCESVSADGRVNVGVQMERLGTRVLLTPTF